MNKHRFDFLLDKLHNTYGLKMQRDHERICTLFEGDLEVFKLMYGFNEEKKQEELVVTFHLDINPALAIRWFNAMHNLDPFLSLKECYYIDDRNEIYYGQAAEAIRAYKDQQQVISDFLETDEDPKEFILDKVYGRLKKDIFTDKDEALKEFNIVNKSDDDTEH